MTTVPLSSSSANREVGRVLNRLAITEMTYYDLAFTQPLVADLLSHLTHAVKPGGRTLLIGGNSLLAHCILTAGYSLDMWRFGENVLADELAGHIRGRIEPEKLAGGRLSLDAAPYDAVLLPLIVEHVPGSPAAILASIRPWLRPDGVCIAASQSMASLGARSRALRGRSYLPPWPDGEEARFSLSWPDLATYQYYSPEELLDYARQAGLRPVVTGYSLGHRAYHGTDFFGLRGYVSRLVRQGLKRAVPSLRDYVVLTLAPEREQTTGDAPAGASQGDPDGHR